MKLQRVEAAEFGIRLQSLMGIANSVGMKKHWPVHEFTCMFLNIGSRSTLASNIGPLMSHSEIRIGSCSTSASSIVSQHWFTLSSNALHTVTSMLCLPLSVLQKNMVRPVSFVAIAVRMSIRCMAGSGTKQVQYFLPGFVLQ